MKFIKKLMTAMIIMLVLTNLDIYGFGNCFIYEAKAVTFDDVNNPEVFLKQNNGDMQCTLVAATMLIRRAAMLSGNQDWADITVDKVKEQAWLEGVGLRYTFTYAGITVNKVAFKTDPVNESISLLKQHPEGIVLYDQIRSPRSHAILLTDYTDGIFYSADPAEAAPSGRILNSSSLVQVKDGESYWYVSSPQISAPSPSITGGSSSSQTGSNSQTSSSSQTIDISTYTATLSQDSFTYDGTEQKPVVMVQGLTENVDYTVTYIDNVKPGQATVNITGTGIYSGTITKSFQIADISILEKLYDIKIIMTKQTIQKGKTATIKVTLPESLKLVKEYSSNQLSNEVKLNYKSENTKIATVNASGKVTGKKSGTAKLFVNVELADGTIKTYPLKIKVN
ncbi:MAG TPA: hypothetical protein VN131_03435 [Mobilitalea sp.]|nr:hypothetical protein [Mobilitalea sp.]